METSEGRGEASEGAVGRRGPGGLASQVGRGFEEGLAVSSFQCSSQVRKVNGSGVSIDSGKDYYRNVVGVKVQLAQGC